MSEALIAFLRARLDEDEQAARAATPGPRAVDSETYAETIYGANDVTVVAGGRWCGEASVFETTEDAAHIARHDPARVLAEVAAKRAIVDYVAYEMADHGADNPWWYDGKLIPILKALASPYRHHPDFRADWVVEAPQ